MLTSPPPLSSATLFCYDNADTSGARKMKCANVEMSENTNAFRLVQVHANTDFPMKKYKYTQECIILCYDNTNTIRAGRMCTNTDVQRSKYKCTMV